MGMLGLCFHCINTVAAGLVLCFLTAFISAHVRKAQWWKFGCRRGACVGIVICLLAVIPGEMRAAEQSPPRVTPLKRLSAADATRFRQIVQGVVGDPRFFTPSVHREFWQMLMKTNASREQIQGLRRQMTGMLATYQPLFWRDALQSLTNGRPFMSAQRRDFERSMVANKMISRDQIHQNNLFIAKIAARQPVPWQGKSIVFNEQMIHKVLGQVRESAQRLDRLFVPPER